MSIQAECREAMNLLATRGIYFTERDVINQVSMPNWTERQWTKAARAAYTVLQSDYRKGRLCRYGPVMYNGIHDYVRNHSKIVYSHAAKGPAFVETPNGLYHRMLAEADRISAVGRRPGIDRDDFTSWDQQATPARDSVDRVPRNDYDPAMLDRLAETLAPMVADKLAVLAAATHH